MRQITLGLIGCGARGKEIILSLMMVKKFRLFNLVAVSDINEKLAKHMGEKYNVPHFNSVQRMLRSEMDFVFICANDYQHHLLGKLAAEEGKNVVVEKPMAISLPCCDILISSCEKAGVHLEIAEQFFRGPTDRAVTETVRNGTIGQVLRAYALDPSIPHFSDSGVCMDMGVHRMSEIRKYIGSSPTRVTGLTRKFGLSNDAPGVLHEDWGFALVEFEGGQTGAVECTAATWTDQGKESYRKIVGTEGIIHVDAQYSTIEGRITLRHRRNGKLANIPVKKHYLRKPPFLKKVLKEIEIKTTPKTIWRNPFFKFNLIETRIGLMDVLMSMRNSILTGEPPEYGTEARRDVEMCVAWYESSLSGKSIQLPIKSTTRYETLVHEDYSNKYGNDPLNAH